VPDWDQVPDETPIDPSGLLDKLIKTRRQLSEAEADNILDAYLKYLSGVPTVEEAPFTFSWALGLHREMLGRVWQWAGQLRTVELTLGVLPE
jgi:fido (protein-threonine AMPylation protein)